METRYRGSNQRANDSVPMTVLSERPKLKLTGFDDSQRRNLYAV
jgi:hypothetical protein